jgi:hypothetical protein
MKFKQLGVLLSLSTIVGINLIANKALAQPIEPSITFGEAIGSGGCRVIDQLIGPDGRSVSIFLDNMKASNGQRQRCLLRIQTTIPSGFLVQDVDVLYQGSVEVGRFSRGITFSRNYSLVGSLGIVSATPQITQFTNTNPLFVEKDDLTVLSASCGASGNFGINMVAQSTLGASFTLDTVDVASAVVRIFIPLRPC